MNNRSFDISFLNGLQDDSSWLCPDHLTSLSVVGGFGDDLFEYVKIAFQACDPEETRHECAIEEELIDVSVNYVAVSAYPDLLSGAT